MSVIRFVEIYDCYPLLDRFDTDAFRNLEDDTPIYGYNSNHVYRTSHNPVYEDSSLSNESVSSVVNGDGYSESPISPALFDRGKT